MLNTTLCLFVSLVFQKLTIFDANKMLEEDNFSYIIDYVPFGY